MVSDEGWSPIRDGLALMNSGLWWTVVSDEGVSDKWSVVITGGGYLTNWTLSLGCSLTSKAATLSAPPTVAKTTAFQVCQEHLSYHSLHIGKDDPTVSTLKKVSTSDYDSRIITLTRWTFFSFNHSPHYSQTNPRWLSQGVRVTTPEELGPVISG